MNVKELIQLLEECDPSAEVVLAKDEEGNGYCLLESVEEGFYNEKTEEFFTEEEFFDESDTVEDLSEDEYDNDYSETPHGIEAVVLRPIY